MGGVPSCKTGRPIGLSATGILPWFSRPDVGSKSLEGVGAGFSFGAGEDIRGGYQLHVHKPGLLNSVQVLSFQESPSDSSRPEIYICLGGIRDRFVHHNVCEIQTATRFQRPEDLFKRLVLVRT